jgi:CofH subfamily radical SAM domain protein
MRLFAARDADFAHVARAADALRRTVSGETVRYVVNRNINYTNICTYRCSFCAFSKGRTHEALRGPAYDLDHGEILRRAVEAWDRGATEVCLQGGIHPDYTGETYEGICRAIRAVLPEMHIHAFSPLEVTQGAATLGLTLTEYLARLKSAGLGTLPGTAAEILDDEIRALICPDKVTTAEWLAVARAAHGLGLRTTATIMFGHVEAPVNWARHLLALRDLQEENQAKGWGGFTEFVPLPFVAMEAPMFLKGQARRGPHLPRGAADARRRAPRPASAYPEHPDQLGEDGPAGRGDGAPGRGERPRRHADEREHQPRRRHAARPGTPAVRDGGADPLHRPRAGPANDALRPGAGGPPPRRLRGASAGAGGADRPTEAGGGRQLIDFPAVLRYGATNLLPERPMPHRRLLLTAAALSLPALAARAQGFPERSLRIVVPFAPGGAVDLTAIAGGAAAARAEAERRRR